MTAHLAVPSPIGPLLVRASEQGIVALSFPGREARAPTSDPGDAPAAHLHLAAAARQLEEYFAGRRREFDLPLRAAGTEFQQEVWRALLGIPYGETRSYSEIARAIGRPDAVRAVGAANGSNPIAVIVPCHRVVGANGALTGFGGGLERKSWLLDHEAGRLLLPLETEPVVVRADGPSSAPGRSDLDPRR